MTEDGIVVLDASVGVKWFKAEAGSVQARALLGAHRDGAVRLVVPSQFVHEVLAVAAWRSEEFSAEVWRLLTDAQLTVVGLDDELVTEALTQCRVLGCSFYDALAPALAVLLEAPLCSADARAHARHPGVRIIG